MNVFIVYAHPEPTSFNGALRDRDAGCADEAMQATERRHRRVHGTGHVGLGGDVGLQEDRCGAEC